MKGGGTRERSERGEEQEGVMKGGGIRGSNERGRNKRE